MKRRSVGAKCCLVVVVLLGSIFGLLIGKTFYDVYKFSTMPHKDMLSPPEVNGTRKARLAPIIDTDTRFDVGITLWAQKDAVDTSESVLREEEYKSFFKETDGKARLGDEVELFSDIVLHDIGLSSKHTQVNISYTLPLQFNRGK
jgi:hypothetical protein